MLWFFQKQSWGAKRFFKLNIFRNKVTFFKCKTTGRFQRYFLKSLRYFSWIYSRYLKKECATSNLLFNIKTLKPFLSTLISSTTCFLALKLLFTCILSSQAESLYSSVHQHKHLHRRQRNWQSYWWFQEGE